MSHDAAKAIILDGSGRHFDPEIVDVMLAIEDEFKDIAARYADE